MKKDKLINEQIIYIFGMSTKLENIRIIELLVKENIHEQFINNERINKQ